MAVGLVAGSAGSAVAARREAAHFSGASADVQFSTCGPAADGDVCAFTLVFASNQRSKVDTSEDDGPCLVVEHIVGYRDGPRGLHTISDQSGRTCDDVRVTIPRSLTAGSVLGTVPTQTCVIVPTYTCAHSDPVAVDLSWQPNGRLRTTAPTTIRYPDYSVGLPCVFHQGLLTTRRAIASGSIPSFGPLGRVIPGTASLRRGELTWVGEHVLDCID
jgi:hypothetical protein